MNVKKIIREVNDFDWIDDVSPLLDFDDVKDESIVIVHDDDNLNSGQEYFVGDKVDGNVKVYWFVYHNGKRRTANYPEVKLREHFMGINTLDWRFIFLDDNLNDYYGIPKYV